ncbi:unnamed protein product [Lactuca saligna]|uniref:Uncharacterized protein n=1 Tax=Lactuca saligna TaxID=75948 RepID=A0AA35VLT0_LACSI|nr:unnamed protein product [Lactuca saligna]
MRPLKSSNIPHPFTFKFLRLSSILPIFVQLQFDFSPDLIYTKRMGRGVSCGGGQSSLGYLLGSGAGQAETDDNAPPPPENTTEAPKDSTEPPSDDATNTQTDESLNQNPTAETSHDSSTNNYHRADGQNCGNFITDRPSTKVHAAPGGNSSLGYLFGDEKK